MQEGAEVEAGAADHDRGAAALEDLLDGRFCADKEVDNVERFVDFADVNEMVGRFLAVTPGDLGRADVHAAVDLRRVGGEDFRLGKGLGKEEREGRFSHGRGTGKNDDLPLVEGRVDALALGTGFTTDAGHQLYSAR